MTPKINNTTATSPCPCKSGKEFKQCCGKYMQDPNCRIALHSLTGETPVRFILAVVSTGETHADEAGSIMVFTDRAQALGLNQQLHYKYSLIGMSERSWKLFQAEVPDFQVISAIMA